MSNHSQLSINDPICNGQVAIRTQDGNLLRCLTCFFAAIIIAVCMYSMFIIAVCSMFKIYDSWTSVSTKTDKTEEEQEPATSVSVSTETDPPSDPMTRTVSFSKDKSRPGRGIYYAIHALPKEAEMHMNDQIKALIFLLENNQMTWVEPQYVKSGFKIPPGGVPLFSKNFDNKSGSFSTYETRMEDDPLRFKMGAYNGYRKP